jgi:hypothetical protein
LARLDESIAAFNQRFIFPRPFAMKIIKINLWNQGIFELAVCSTEKGPKEESCHRVGRNQRHPKPVSLKSYGWA